MFKYIVVVSVLGLSGYASVQTAQAQTSELPDVKTEDLGHGLYMLVGRGGNVGVSVGEDGILVIDDQYENMAPKLLEAIRAISDKPIKYLVNTHHHGDHSGGNVPFHEHGATIIAHHNVYTRLASKPKAAQPTLTYETSATFHMNDEEARLVYLPAAHTDGDSLVYFPSANVLHMGDTFFNTFFPYIDVGSGGTIDGAIAAQETALALINGETKIIPGHGPLASKTDLQTTRDMLVDVRAILMGEIAKGHNVDQAIAADALGKYASYGDAASRKRFIQIVYNDLTRD